MRKVFSFILTVFAIIVIIFAVLAMLPDVAENKNVETTTESQTTENTTQKQEPTTEKVDTMVQQFISLGFTQAEAENMKAIFNTVGITEISNIQAVGNNGIDNLQVFNCDIYDYHREKGSPYIRFVIDKRQLCFISMDGLYGDSYSDRNNVELYDIWDENGEIDKSAIGYQAVFDYENSKITEYEP